ncbi:CRISPR-associated RAMP protein, Csm5 family [Thermococcus cleftensis]|uniref:CRISPR system Cms protein Csm5 n=1 Tax=Thermococcus cleftensis (strain DSM 27260 / KACC 17922 / CL1) TaxID=163003 RepID=I3ZWR8_THECF|nr:type III-A CRISPR-associated RAMP protein Csm5 [Thermococcus cleftensis]AFL96152.1 CRISPR-associated RAMP protein, Csm5 family [Thermococcus cleftensis]
MKLTVLSPLHIGNGNELTVIDVLPLNDGRIAVLDLERLMLELTSAGADVEEILTLVKAPDIMEDMYIWKRYLSDYGVGLEKVKKYTLPVVGRIAPRSMRIREFIKSSGRPYIPGSSVKGSIRTAVFYHVALKYRSRVEKLLEKLADSEGRINPKRADDELEMLVFGYARGRRGRRRYEPKRDPMRALVVRDSEPLSIRNLKVYAVSTVGGKSEIPQYVEGVEGIDVEIEIRVDNELLSRAMRAGELNGLLADTIKGKEDFEDLIWKAIDSFSREVISFERRELRKYGAFRESVGRFYSQLERMEGHKLRVGWGSGWYSMTLGPLILGTDFFKHIRRKFQLGRKPGTHALSGDFPKTRRVANSRPMGWVILRE